MAGVDCNRGTHVLEMRGGVCVPRTGLWGKLMADLTLSHFLTMLEIGAQLLQCQSVLKPCGEPVPFSD